VFTVKTGLASETDRDESLDGINTTYLKSGAFGWVQSGGAALMLFRLDREDDTTPADGVTVIAPLTGPGRWKAFGGSGAGGCVVRTGFDCPIESPDEDIEICLATNSTADALFLFPRQQNVVGNPVEVAFPSFGVDNILTWNWALTLRYEDNSVASNANLFGVFPVVELNGALFALGNYGQTARASDQAAAAPNRYRTLTGQAHLQLDADQLAGGPPKAYLGCVINDGAAGAEWKVQVAGQLDQLDSSFSLECRELQNPCVFQKCPVELIDATQQIADPPFCGE
jgi:hypothetical protein